MSLAPAPVAVAAPNLRRRLVELDAVCIATAWGTTLAVGMARGRIEGGVVQLALETAGLTLIGLGLMALLRMYRSRVITVRTVTLERTALISVALAASVWTVGRAMSPHPSIQVPVIGGIVCFVALVSCRACFDAWVMLRRRDGSLSRPVVLVGPGAEVAEMTELLIGHPEIGYRPAGYMSDGPSSEPCLREMHWIGPTARGAEGVQSVGATGAVIAANGMRSPELNTLVRDLHDAHLHVHLSSGLWRIGHRRLRQLPLAHEPFFYLEPPTMRRVELSVKRGMDLVIATLVIIVTSPVVAVAAALIKLSDWGPVFFRQVRVGQHGEEVVVHKLRTMTCDAEDQLDALRAQNDRTGPLFKMADDPRVTRVGRWLRATSIDELPQLFDVVAGRLSLVGPRPALPSEVELFDDELLERQRIRPGVTGLWQVEARHNSSFYAYRHLDLFYLENWSLGLDVAIILATLASLVSDTLTTLERVHRRRQNHASAEEAHQADPTIASLGPLPPGEPSPIPAPGEDRLPALVLAGARSTTPIEAAEGQGPERAAQWIGPMGPPT